MALKRSRQSSALRILCNLDAPCSFDGYQCTLGRVEGFEYCLRHILEDKNSPFRQCSYIYTNNSKRCLKPSPVTEKKESYCIDHSCQALKKKHLVPLKEKLNASPELCISQLAHHQISSSTLQNAIPDPANVPSIASTALQYISQDEDMNYYFSELDVRLLPRAEDDSELDSAESDADPLEHAVVFTTEEASRIYVEKLQQLKALYTGEYKRLHHLLRENRRQYLQTQKIENETSESIHSQPRESVDEREAYQELKFLARFHHSLGKEALLVKQSNEKRALNSDAPGAKSNSTVGSVKCIYSEGSWRCATKSIPLSKYCFRHIMQDERQVLFRSCGSLQGGGEKCEIPIIPLPHTTMCIYHTPLINPLPVSDPIPSWEGRDGLVSSRPRIIDLTDSSTFIISEIPPKEVMEGDSVINTKQGDPVLSMTEQVSREEDTFGNAT